MNKHLAAFLLVTAVCIIAYCNSLQNGFVYDDASVIVENRYITDISNIRDIFSKDDYFARSGVGKYRRYGEGSYRPIVTLSYFMDAVIWKKNPFGYHLANLIYHLLYVLVLYFLIFRLSGSFTMALMSSAISAIHPVMTEAVNAISFREDILCGLFFCSGFLLFIMYVKCRTRPIAYLITACISYLMACLSKENGIMLPLLIAGYIVWMDRSPSAKRFSLQLKRFKKEYIFLGVTAVIYLIIRFGFFNFTVDAAPQVTINLMATRFIRFFNVISYYLGIILVPHRLTPAFNNDFLESPVLLIVSIPVLAGYCYLIRIQRYNGLTALFLSWFLITLLPISGLVYLNQPVAERYLYLPMIGVICATVIFLFKILHRKKLFLPVFSVIIIVFTARTVAQNAVWKNEFDLWSYTIKYAPKDYNTVSNYAIALADAKRYEDSIVYYKKAIELDDRAQTHYNLANAYTALGLKKQAEKEFRTSIKKDPNYSEAHNNLGRILAESGKYEEAIDEIKIAIALNPYNAMAYNNLGGCYNQLGNYEEAKKALRRALNISPGYISASFNLGTSYFKLGEYDKAIEMMEYVLHYEPNNKHAYQYLESIKRQKSIIKQHQGTSAGTSVQETVSGTQPPDTSAVGVTDQRKPAAGGLIHAENFAGRYDAQQAIREGDMLMQSGQYPQALKMYRIAVNSQPSNPVIHVKLAECYMRLGSFDLAHKTLVKALELDPENKTANQRMSEIQRILQLPSAR
ncbi:MAG: tetratricopeptide repeat protein [Candidatus Auribacterota bacterium]|jgi:tetratricopeptide (TPR) repeat protein|nr:tetratricopeptide repeat protein [Candidatus Auribacterota bacterium]